ncbi:serine--tRNA ligase [Desulfitobacterium hafniense]|uniref:Serine--tRNA ligase n=3 Tax=Desulfitobacterium hafniense TaxID=49338 RepID=SYS_DESHY|nr:serine--tRNA ligase [Desulfitobacterium hafniense]Q252J5.1 RecName: Full=Serine--tRNA ligase; AltName: Full=Seryl-tRNA synthetase; Short=SerRS; AltName: Full=Seryl-tRNA(Ser/Sec) synthetase [Desulfitobacterium hafniense Y51]KTE93415.1 serine--tRNA ligase [Desulfitobacterium hafniense]BAE81797.1 seryl-tRNA synthetase [Desulfitobacterium hafniense Y51]
MLDLKFVRTNPEVVKEALKKRNSNVSLDAFLEQEEERRKLLFEVESLKAKRNTVSEEVGRRKKHGEDAEQLILEMREVGQKVKNLEDKLGEIEQSMEAVLYEIPNIPHESVPVGADEEANVEVRTWGTPRSFDFEPLAHYEIGEKLDILDFARAGKVTGARFTFYKGLGAKLERALISFMLDRHSAKGYVEVLPPYMVHRNSMIGTGQLPKFEEDAFKVAGTDYFLIPTAEVPVTNMYREEILEAEQLPIHHCAYSACFRAEAGSAGRDTRGLIRQHQFNKVELVKFAFPENSYEELESLTRDAESILQELELPYRVMALSTGDLGFTSAKTYDLEVWLPSFNTYREISSCSNFEDFQARRANIRFRRAPKAKPEFLHTLNGSGLAIGRTVSAILENYQEADGRVRVPKALQPYLGVEYIG